MHISDMSMKEGHDIKVTLKLHDDCKHFTINIGHDFDNLAMHLDGRFDIHGDTNTIVFNCKSGGCWGDEHREHRFPFSAGDECKICINFTNEQFYIKLPDGSMTNFENRMGECKYKYFSIAGDAKLVGIKIK